MSRLTAETKVCFAQVSKDTAPAFGAATLVPQR